MSETLRYISLGPKRHTNAMELIVQLTNGGAAAELVIGETAESVVSELRHLANLLEDGVKARAKAGPK